MRTAKNEGWLAGRFDFVLIRPLEKSAQGRRIPLADPSIAAAARLRQSGQDRRGFGRQQKTHDRAKGAGACG